MAHDKAIAEIKESLREGYKAGVQDAANVISGKTKLPPKSKKPRKTRKKTDASEAQAIAQANVETARAMVRDASDKVQSDS